MPTSDLGDKNLSEGNDMCTNLLRTNKISFTDDFYVNE